MTPIQRVMQIEDPYMRLLGAKLVSLLTEIVDEGRRTTDNLEQLQVFADMADLRIPAREMVETYKQIQLGQVVRPRQLRSR